MAHNAGTFLAVHGDTCQSNTTISSTLIKVINYLLTGKINVTAPPSFCLTVQFFATRNWQIMQQHPQLQLQQLLKLLTTKICDRQLD